ncbi:protein EARLY FLOWERING 3-like [Juglans microcarpa x Juglans regia]|uniref:protein EARLY FLOWERING 3-like n=1 Tax=Juglans microcarpa x Juglans regia TaxID=2249226 RepID=UPI001B7DE5F1|nr:protein EARLY FLOWERING 3-like [Juglans microcarpa x Juglans regia]
MRGGKYEEKSTSPMFPRLHVNDTEKGGPRAPPRNKMALYEQLSIPSQRLTSGSASMLPIRPSNSSSLTPSMSASHVDVHQRSMLTPFCNSPSPSHLAENPHPSSLSGDKLNTVMASHEQNSLKPTCFQTLNATGPSSSTSKCESFRPYNFSCFKKLSSKKLGGEDDRVLTSGLGITPHCGKDQEKFPPLSLSPSVKLQTACEKQINGNGTIDLKWMGFKRKQAGDNTKVFKGNVAPLERSASITSSKDKNLVDTSSIPLARVKNSESLKRTRESSNQEDRSSLVHNSNRLKDTSSQFHKACVTVQDRTAPGDDIVKPGIGVGTKNVSELRSKSCSSPSLGDECRSINGLVNGSECCEDKKCKSTKVASIPDNALDTYVVESMPNLNVSPDDVVGVIGEKLFWKARRAIINQQRVFAVQVFELHRLIKVQKLIAGSPDLLLEDDLYLGKKSIKVSPVKNLPSSAHVPEPPAPLIVRDNNNSLKSNPNIEYADENVVGKFPLPSIKNDSNKGLVTTQSNDGFHSANPPLAPVATNTKPAPWCFHPPPGNQWLVPAMSPSEGLVYKPYTGSSLPTAGFMAPAYGNCGRVSPGSVDLLNTVYGVPVSHPSFGILPGSPPLGQSYFPLYGMPLVNQSLSSSAVEQTSPLAAAQSNGQNNQALAGERNFTIPHQSSCNMSGNVSWVISGQVGKLPASKESEFQGSTASSPSERAIGDALPLFPTTPTVQASDKIAQNSEQRAQVIKVVPRNPRSASESAFRIFRSIQEERKQL